VLYALEKRDAMKWAANYGQELKIDTLVIAR
jgi:hypothetical protein